MLSNPLIVVFDLFGTNLPGALSSREPTMRLPFRAWKQTLKRLNLRLVNPTEKDPPQRRTTKLGMEALEDRKMMAVDLSVASTSMEENAASIAVTFSRDHSSGDENVYYSTSGAAVKGSDYQITGAGAGSNYVQIEDGETSRTVYFDATNDGIQESDETATITLTADTSKTADITIQDNDDWTVQISTTDAVATEQGETTGTYKITRSGETDLSNSLRVYFDVSGTASSSDFDSLPGSSGYHYESGQKDYYDGYVDIAANQTEVTFDLTPDNDDVNESDETVIVTLDELEDQGGGYGGYGGYGFYDVGTNDNATVTIEDNDDWTVEITTTDAIATEQGETTGTYKVTRSGETDLTHSLRVYFDLSGTAYQYSDYDYAALPGQSGYHYENGQNDYYDGYVDIAANQTEVTFDLTPENDNVNESDETVIVTLDELEDQGGGYGGYGGYGFYNVGTNDSATVTIQDNDDWTVEITTTDAIATEQGETTGTYKITRSGETDLSHSLRVYFDVSGTASSSDYDSLPGSSGYHYENGQNDYYDGYVDIAANQTEVTFDLTPENDGINESDETVVVTLDELEDQGGGYGGYGGYGFYDVGTNDSATVTIQDNDDWTVEITTTDAIATEEGETTGTYKVTRSGETDLTHSLRVYFDLSGTAYQYSDYDYDALPGQSGYHYENGQNDYYDGYVDIAANQTEVTFDLTPENDAANEGDETVIVTLDELEDQGGGYGGYGGYGFYNVGTNDSATVTIQDNDDWTVEITATDAIATEQGETTGTYKVTRSGETDLTHSLRVYFDLSGTAYRYSDYDYAALPGQSGYHYENGQNDYYDGYVDIAANQTEVTFDLTPENDGINESDETVIVTLDELEDQGGGYGGYGGYGFYDVGTNDNATVTIQDNDDWTVEIEAITPFTQETSGTPVPGQFEITRTGETDLTHALTVYFDISGTAYESSDYQSLPGQSGYHYENGQNDYYDGYVTIAANETSAIFDVTPIDDSEDEPTETVIVTIDELEEQSGGYGGYGGYAYYNVKENYDVDTVYIRDDEALPIIVTAYEADALEPLVANQDEDFAVYRIERPSADSSAVQVDFTFVNNGGDVASTSDYRLATAAGDLPSGQSYVTIAANEKYVDLYVYAEHDTINEGIETLTIQLTSENHADYLIDTPFREATIYIHNMGSGYASNVEDLFCNCKRAGVGFSQPASGDYLLRVEASDSTWPEDWFGIAQPELIYRHHAVPQPIILYDYIIGSNTPDTLTAELTLGNSSTEVVYDTDSLSEGDVIRVALQIKDASLASGRHFYQITFTETTGSTEVENVVDGFRNVVNHSDEFGDRWFLQGLDSLIVEDGGGDVPAGVLLARGNGSSAWFALQDDGSYSTPEGQTPLTLVKTTGGYEITTPNQSKNSFNAAGQLVSSANAQGSSITFAYDGSGRVETITNPFLRTLNFTYDGNGELSNLNDWSGRDTTYVITSGELESITYTDPDGAGALVSSTWDFTYDSNGYLDTVSDLKNDDWTIETNFAGLATGGDNPKGEPWSLASTTSFGLVDTSGGNGTVGTPATVTLVGNVAPTFTGEDGVTTDLETNRFDQITGRTNPVGGEVVIEKDGNARTLGRTITDPDGAGPLGDLVTSFERDETGNLLTRTNADNTSESYTYDAVWNTPTSFTDAENRQTFFTVDQTTGLNTEIIQVVGNKDDGVNLETDDIVTTYTFTDGTGATAALPVGLVLTQTDALGRVTKNTYETDTQSAEFGFLLSTTTDDGGADEATVSYEYDADGNRDAMIDALGRRTEYVFDATGRLTKTVLADPDGVGSQTSPEISFTYNSAGQVLTETDALGNVTTYTYDDAFRLLTVTQPDPDGVGSQTAPVTTYDYDEFGNLASVTDALGNITRFEYDAANRLIKTTEEYPDRAGSVVVANTATEYSESGASWADNGSNREAAAGTGTNTATWTFDNLEIGLQYELFVTYDESGSLATDSPFTVAGVTAGATVDIDQTAAAAGFTHDSANYVSLGSYTASSETITVTLSDDAAATVAAGAVLLTLAAPVTQTEYDTAGNRTKTIDALGNETVYEYDSRFRLIKVTLPDPDGAGSQTSPIVSYTYNDAGQLETQTDALGRVTTYAYDDLGRQISVTRPDPDGAGSQTAPVTSYTYDDVGNRLTATDPLGNVTTYTYDDQNRLVTITQTDPDGAGSLTSPVTTYAYDDAGQLLSITDPLNRVTSYAYDDLGRQTSTTSPDPDGAGSQTSPVTSTTYDAAGNVLTQTDAFGNVTSYEFDDLQRLVKVTQADPDGAGSQTAPEMTYTYDALGRMITMTDALGRTTTYEYDALGRQTKITLPDPDGVGSQTAPVQQTVYDVHGNVIASIDALGNKTRYEYDNLHRQVKVIQADPDGVGSLSSPETTYEYDAAGQLTKTTDALGRETVYAYDDLGRRVTVTEADPDGGGSQTSPVTTYAYDAAGNLTSITDALGNVTSYEYDDLHRRTKVTEADPDGVGSLTSPVTTYTYDAAGQTLTVTDPLNRVTTYAYDDLGRQISVTMPDPDGAGSQTAPVISYTYDAHGNMLTQTDANGNVTNYEYDDLHRKIKVTQADPDGAGSLASPETEYEYDAAGQVTKVTDALDRETTYVYDNLGRRTTVTQPDPDGVGSQTAPVTTYTFDAVGNMLTVTDALGNVTTYQYDNLYRQIKVIEADPDGAGSLASPETEYEYDAAGQLTKMIDALDRETSYAYDDLGRRTTVTQADPDGAGTQTSPVTSYVYDAVGNTTSVTDALGNVTAYEYDDLYRQTKVTEADPDGVGSQTAPETSFTYDAAGQTLSTTDAEGRVTNYAYDDLGRQTSVTLPDPDGAGSLASPVLSSTYDSVGNQLTQTDPLGNVTSYEYDALNRRVKITAADPDGAGSLTSPVTEYEFDAAGQLIKVTDPLDRETTYAYDDLGRRTTVTMPDPDGAGSQTAPVTSYTFDAVGNQLTQTDANGNVTTYAYDNLYRVTKFTGEDPDGAGAQVSPETTYTYDAAGQTLTTTDPDGQTITYGYDDLGRRTNVTLPDPDGAGSQTASVTTYAFDAVGNLLSETDPLSNVTSYTYDNLYRQITLTDANDDDTDYTYDLVGNLLSLTDAVGNVTEFEYDDLDRKTSEEITVDSVDLTRTFEYDAANNLAQRVDRNGGVITYDYDGLHRLINETWYEEVADVGITAEELNSIDLVYDARGNVTSIADDFSDYDYTFDELDRILTVTSNNSGAPEVVLTNEYDANGLRTELSAEIDGSADFINAYTYDDLNRLTQVTQTAGVGASVVDKRVDFTYTDAGLRSTIDRYQDLTGTDLVASTTYAYDDQNRLTDLDHEKGATLLASYDWTFDAEGRITQFDSSEDGVVDYTYDDRGQLTEADYDYQDDENYTFDDNGNRTNTGYSTGDHNRLESDGEYDYEYDDEGNRTRREDTTTGDYITYTWDTRSRLINVKHYDDTDTLTKEAVYEYDVYNRRISRQVDDTGNGTIDSALRYKYDESGKVDINGHGHLDDVVLVFDESEELVNRYLHGEGIDEILADEQFVSELFDELHWMLADNQGSIRDLVEYDTDTTTNINHITYGSGGDITSETDATKTPTYAFAGREWDDIAHLYYVRERWLDPYTSQFASEDPLGFAAGDTNVRRYVGNSAPNKIDPSGLDSIDVNPDGAVIWTTLDIPVGKYVQRGKQVRIGKLRHDGIVLLRSAWSAGEKNSIELGRLVRTAKLSLVDHRVHDINIGINGNLAGERIKRPTADPTHANAMERLAVAKASYDADPELEGWVIAASHSDKVSGFRAAAFQNKENPKEILIAYAGTDVYFDTTAQDARENVIQGLGMQSLQYAQALSFAKSVQGKYPDHDLRLVGHSLGGGLACATSMRTDIPATTFNPSGVHDHSVPFSRKELAKKSKELVVAYRVKGDLLGSLQDWDVLPVDFMPDTGGTIYEIYGNSKNPAVLHGSAQVEVGLQRGLIRPYDPPEVQPTPGDALNEAKESVVREYNNAWDNAVNNWHPYDFMKAVMSTR